MPMRKAPTNEDDESVIQRAKSLASLAFDATHESGDSQRQ